MAAESHSTYMYLHVFSICTEYYIIIYILCISIELRSDNMGMGQHGDLVDHGF